MLLERILAGAGQLERTVRHIGVAGLQEPERAWHPGEPSVAAVICITIFLRGP